MMYTLLWLGWFAAFFAIEIPALRAGKPGGSLSEHVWDWFSIRGNNGRFVRTRRLALLCGLAWLCTHFLTGGWV